MQRPFNLTLICLLFLLAFSGAAVGQGGNPDNPCNIPDPTIPVYYTDLKSSATGKLWCLPAPGGPGVGLTIRSNTAGMTAWWWCPDKTPNPTSYGAPNFAAATWARILTGNLTPDTPMADPTLTPVWCPFHDEMHASKPVVAGPPPAMVTAGSTTYNSAAGALAGFAGLGKKGAACDCTKSFKVGTSTYCTFAGAASPSIVAQCVKP